MSLPSRQAAAMLGFSLFYGSISMAVSLLQCFDQMEPARVLMSELVSIFLPVFLLKLLLSSGFAYACWSVAVGLCLANQLAYLFWLTLQTLTVELPLIVRYAFLVLHVFSLLAILYLLFPVADALVETRLATRRVPKVKASFSTILFWSDLAVTAVLILLRVLLSSWFPLLNTHLMLFFLIFWPHIQMHAIFKQRDSLVAIQWMAGFLSIAEIVYMFQIGLQWSSHWSQIAAVIASILQFLLLQLSMYTMEELKSISFAQRLAQLL